MAATWLCLPLAAALSTRVGLGPDAAVLVAFGAAVAINWRCGAASWQPPRPRLLASAWLGGAMAFVPLREAAVLAGLALGLVPHSQALASHQAPSPALALAVLVLAPVFEEHLYRGALLPALTARLGRALALVLSSALFALPHVEPWAVVGSFVAGLALGVLWLRSHSASACVAAHAGLNSAALALEAAGAWGAR